MHAKSQDEIHQTIVRTRSGRICWQSIWLQTQLAKWNANGFSAADIADHLQCRRDQVAGAMRRYGLFVGRR